LRKHYNLPEEQIVYFRVHAQADLEEHQGVMAHAELDWTVLKKLLEQGRAETRPGFNLAYCLRMGTAYFAWFFEGVYQHIKKEGLYKT
jgi:predicted metal-binding protein